MNPVRAGRQQRQWLTRVLGIANETTTHISFEHMNYQALAIKYRPQSFADFSGQSSTVTALVNALNKQQLHHAYLFSGTRGVGKTTLARLLSKCLNCEQGISANPCQTCTHCVDMTAGRHMDLIEIDAASRTKVEDTRELLDNVPYAATSARFKVYLIDEVHMLSKHSFNALLKTLEEPPSHVKFILATTEPEKIPSTIRSRCLHFALSKISPTALVERLSHVLQQEKIDFEVDALPPIAQAANGSLRDALSLLDKTIAYADGHLSLEKVKTALGLDHTDTACQLIECLAQSNVEMILHTTEQLAEHDHDFNEQLRTMCKWFHQISTQQMLAKHNQSIGVDAIEKLAKLFEPSQIQVYYHIALRGQKDMAYAPTPQIGFEMTLLCMLAFEPNTATQPAPNHQQNLSHQHAQTTSKASPNNTKHLKSSPNIANTNTATATKSNPAHHNTRTTNTPVFDATSSAQDRWLHVIDQLKLAGISQQIAQHCVCHTWSTDTIELQAEPKHAPLLSETQQKKIKQAIQQHLNHAINVTFSFNARSNNDQTMTPAQSKQLAHQKKLQASTHQIQQDTQAQAILTKLDATLLPDSVVLSDD